jgi:hypothetical protein
MCRGGLFSLSLLFMILENRIASGVVRRWKHISVNRRDVALWHSRQRAGADPRHAAA